MGSLLPGWNSGDVGVPKDLRDYNDNEAPEKHGYFASYSMRKTARKQQADQQQSGSAAAPAGAAAAAGEAGEADRMRGVRSLRRSSMPAMLPAHSPLRRVPSGDLQTPLLLGQEGPRHLDHNLTMPPTGTRRSVSETGYMDPLGLDQHMKSLDAYKIGHEHDQQDKTSSTWWKKLSSSALNEMALEEESPARRGKEAPFRPQFAVTGQGLGAFRLHTHRVTEDANADAPSQAEASTVSQDQVADAQGA